MSSQSFEIVSLDGTTEFECLVVKVPVFPRGSYPAAAEHCLVMAPQYSRDTDIPVYMYKSIILDLASDESYYRHAHPNNDWKERCWLMLGKILRDDKKKLFLVVKRVIAALNVNASASFFEFSPATWREIKKEIEPTTEEIILGWIHTHSVKILIENASTNTTRHSDNEQLQTIQASPAAECEKFKASSGLFLSATDVASAFRNFGAPFQLQCILDSDLCMKKGNKVKDGEIGEIFGVWGWLDGGGVLCRRSLFVIGD